MIWTMSEKIHRLKQVNTAACGLRQEAVLRRKPHRKLQRNTENSNTQGHGTSMLSGYKKVWHVDT